MAPTYDLSGRRNEMAKISEVGPSVVSRYYLELSSDG